VNCAANILTRAGRALRALTALLLLTAATATVSAHVASNSFLTINVAGNRSADQQTRVAGQIELAVRDAELAVGLDTDSDGKVTWAEAQAHRAELITYLDSTVILSFGGKACHLAYSAFQVNDRVDGAYLWLPFSGACETNARTAAGAARSEAALSVDYRVMQDLDPSHRGLLSLSAWNRTQTGVLVPGKGHQVFTLDRPSWLAAFAGYLRIGVWHIWSGIDHLLFLLSLLLPAVLRRHNGQWEAVPLARPAFVNILKVVTAFTVAHSITLSLAALDVLHLPSRLTESIIAASILVAALNNLVPKVTQHRWRIAFAFGLLHGFGFASVLTEMGLPPGARLLSLVAFNLGVEVGQLAVVLAVMPLAFSIRATRFYRHTVMRWGSTAIGALALVWFVQRAAG
jgi:hypothetical protein